MLQAVSDNDVIWQVRNGDTQSYGLLAARYHRSLQRVARRILRSEADAEDAVQEAHLRALTRIHQYAGAGYFSWMYSIVVNEALTQLRKRKRFVEMGESNPERLCSQVRSPEQQVLEQNADVILERAVQTLPPAYQPVYRCREMQDLSTAETGERLGLTAACVKSRLFRAKKLVRKRLRQTFDRGIKPEQATVQLQSRSRELPSRAVERGGWQC